jgi:hypothetical protein
VEELSSLDDINKALENDMAWDSFCHKFKLEDNEAESLKQQFTTEKVFDGKSYTKVYLILFILCLIC